MKMKQLKITITYSHAVFNKWTIQYEQPESWSLHYGRIIPPFLYDMWFWVFFICCVQLKNMCVLFFWKNRYYIFHMTLKIKRVSAGTMNLRSIGRKWNTLLLSWVVGDDHETALFIWKSSVDILASTNLKWF